MSVPINWRLRTQRYSLEGNLCPKCGSRYFPPREICPQCSTMTEPFAELMQGHHDEHSGELETAKAVA